MSDPSDKKTDEPTRIPTLHELVKPGKITPRRRQTVSQQEEKLRALVEEAVNRHMERVREDIIRRVMADLQDRTDTEDYGR